MPKILQEALKRIEDGFQKIRTQEAQRNDVVQEFGVRLQARFQEVNKRQSQLKKDVGDARGDIRKLVSEIQKLWQRPVATQESLNAVAGQLWDRPVVTEETLQSVTNEIRQGANALEHRVKETEIRTRDLLRNANQELLELTMRFEDLTEQVGAGGQAPKGSDPNQRLRSRSPQEQAKRQGQVGRSGPAQGQVGRSGPAETPKATAVPGSPFDLNYRLSCNEQTEMLTQSFDQALGAQQPPTPLEPQPQLLLGNDDGRQ